MKTDTRTLPRVQLETVRLLHAEYQQATRMLRAVNALPFQEVPPWGRDAAIEHHADVRRRVLEALDNLFEEDAQADGPHSSATTTLETLR